MSSTMLKWFLTLVALLSTMFSISCFFLKTEASREMKSKFESGIDQNEQSAMPFYMHFFYVGILFLIFDVEIILSIPMIQSSSEENYWMLFWFVFIFLVFLGLVLETYIDSIEWKE